MWRFVLAAFDFFTLLYKHYYPSLPGPWSLHSRVWKAGNDGHEHDCGWLIVYNERNLIQCATISDPLGQLTSWRSMKTGEEG